MTRIRWILAACLMAAPAGAVENPLRPRGPEVVEAGFRCRLPPDWKRSDIGSAGDTVLNFSGLDESIEVGRYGGKDSTFPTQDDYLRFLTNVGVKVSEAGEVTVAGAKRKLRAGTRIRKQRPTYEGSMPTHERTHSEHVIIPQGNRFWVLTFRSQEESVDPTGGEITVWRDFLKSFKFQQQRR